MELSFPWGEKELELELPPPLQLTCIAEAKKPPPLANLKDAVRHVLSHPTGSLPLAQLARKAKKTVVVVDDVGRPTPAHLILPTVVDELLLEKRETEEQKKAIAYFLSQQRQLG